MKKLTQGKWKNYYNQFGVKITNSELALYKSLIPKVRQITRRKQFETKIKPSINRLQSFRSRAAFKTYLSKMNQIAKGTYERNIAIRFRQNLISAINNSERNRFSNQDIENLTKKIRSMSLKDFIKYSKRYRWRSIGYVYYEESPTSSELLAIYGF